MLSFHCSLAGLVAHLTRRLNRFQWMYTLITFVCLIAFWLPLTDDPRFRQASESAGSVDHVHSTSNSTGR